MKRVISTLVLVSLSLYGSSHKEDERYRVGKAIYEETCISCHGVDGNTNPDMQLVVKPRKLSKTILTQEQSVKIISEGAHYWGAHADIMPAWKYVYDKEQIEAVAYFISKEFNANRDERVQKLLDESQKVTQNDKKNMLKVGEKIFKKNCSLCHGITGNGESEYVEKSKSSNIFIYPYNLTRTLLTQEQIFLYAKFGGHYWGTYKSDMPTWKKKYNDIKLKSVAKYVKEKIVQIKE